jgi:hypothetical protein
MTGRHHHSHGPLDEDPMVQRLLQLFDESALLTADHGEREQVRGHCRHLLDGGDFGAVPVVGPVIVGVELATQLPAKVTGTPSTACTGVARSRDPSLGQRWSVWTSPLTIS